MTDNEIVEALEDGIKIGDSPIGKYWGCMISKLTAKEAVDLINRQKAENERLKTNLNIELENYATEYDNKIKAEAYREFAIRLLALIGSVELPNLELRRHINNLLNELVGDDE